MMKHINLEETDRKSAKTGGKKLKNIQWEGKTKPEKVISLDQSQVTKLEAFKQVDRALVNENQQRWLEY